MLAVDPYFDPKVTLGSVLVAGSMLVAAFTSAATALLAWRDLNWRVKNSEKWQSDHEKSCEQNETIINQLREIVTEMKSMVANSDKRIERGEVRIDRMETVLLRRGEPNRR